MSDFIQDNGEPPSAIKRYVRWFLVALMLLCVYFIGVNLYVLKGGPGRYWAVWGLIFGTFCFLVLYTIYWLLRD